MCAFENINPGVEAFENDIIGARHQVYNICNPVFSKVFMLQGF